MRQAAHDLANLLTVECGHRQQSEKYLEKALEHARQASKAGELMMEICRRMLTDKLSTPTPGVFDLNVVVDGIVGAIESLRNGVTVTRRCFDQPLPVAGDALMMHRALFNLCLNALNAGAKRVSVITTVCQGQACVTVRDTGPGFPPGMIENIWSLPVSADGKHGHGLAIVKKTIAQHNGAVRVESGPSGTTFMISLPFASETVGTLAA